MESKQIILIGGSFITVVGTVLILMFGIPIYSVWQQGLSGKADLEKATQQRKILVQQAEAERDAAKARAEAIAIVGKAAKQYPEYRHQEFMGAFAEALSNEGIQKIIFVPTEANIPIVQSRNDSD